MPITYFHRVPASTLGGMALRAGQEQFASERAREERARAMQMAQMAQQQQMQNQRLAYDAASTQYRTAAAANMDYGKFVMGAQIDAQQREQAQRDRLALQEQADQNAQQRDAARWATAEGVAQQQDTFEMWDNFVSETMPTLNSDGQDLLNSAAGKVRNIRADTKFNPQQQQTAVAQVLNETQARGLGQNFAKEQQYEAGKSYSGPNGWNFKVDEKGNHIVLGQGFEGIEKPSPMTQAHWEENGKQEAWFRKYQFGPGGERDENGKLVKTVLDHEGKPLKFTIEDEVYQAKQAKEIDDALRAEDTKLVTDWMKVHQPAVDAHMKKMEAIAPIKEMNHPGVGGDLVGEPFSTAERLEEYNDRMEKAKKRADELYPKPKSRASAPAIEDEAGMGMLTTEEVTHRLPSTEDPAGLSTEDPDALAAIQGRLRSIDPASRSPAGRAVLKDIDRIADPDVRGYGITAAEILDSIHREARNPTPEETLFLNKATRAILQFNEEAKRVRLEGGLQEQSPYGRKSRQRLRQAGDWRQGASEGGIGDPEEAKRLAAQGIFLGAPARKRVRPND